MASSNDEAPSEASLQEQGVVPVYSLDDLGKNECRDGQRAPWTQIDIGNKGKGKELPPYRDGCPPLIFGGSVLGKGIHSDDAFFASTEPYRVVRLALQYGITALDTSPFYHPSEISLGRILKALKPQQPRESYYLQTKVGRFGPEKKDFDYRPERIRQSIKTSLERLDTTYLDAALLHDVEFVATTVGAGQQEGFAARDVVSSDDSICGKARHDCGLADADADDAADSDLDAKIHGDGDQAILDAAQTLFELKDQGLVRNVGIAGLPLPVLLRLSRLIASRAPYRPVDVIVSYSHHTLNNDLLMQYRELFAQEPAARRTARASDSSIGRWRAPRLLNASPFSMGLLLDKGPPEWHPASNALKQAARDASQLLKTEGKGRDPTLVQTAARFGMRGSEVGHRDASTGSLSVSLPTIVGVNSTEQVHEAVEAFRVMLAGAAHEQRGQNKGDTSGIVPLVDVSPPADDSLLDEYHAQQHNERLVMDLFAQRSLSDRIWASGA